MPYSSRAKYVHKRKIKPSKFDKRSFRIVKKKKGCLLIVLACPKKAYNARSKRCKVGLKVQKVMYKKSCYPHKRGD